MVKHYYTHHHINQFDRPINDFFDLDILNQMMVPRANDTNSSRSRNTNLKSWWREKNKVIHLKVDPDVNPNYPNEENLIETEDMFYTRYVQKNFKVSEFKTDSAIRTEFSFSLAILVKYSQVQNQIDEWVDPTITRLSSGEECSTPNFYVALLVNSRLSGLQLDLLKYGQSNERTNNFIDLASPFYSGRHLTPTPGNLIVLKKKYPGIKIQNIDEVYQSATGYYDLSTIHPDPQMVNLIHSCETPVNKTLKFYIYSFDCMKLFQLTTSTSKINEIQVLQSYLTNKTCNNLVDGLNAFYNDDALKQIIFPDKHTLKERLNSNNLDLWKPALISDFRASGGDIDNTMHAHVRPEEYYYRPIFENPFKINAEEALTIYCGIVIKCHPESQLSEVLSNPYTSYHIVLLLDKRLKKLHDLAKEVNIRVDLYEQNYASKLRAQSQKYMEKTLKRKRENLANDNGQNQNSGQGNTTSPKTNASSSIILHDLDDGNLATLTQVNLSNITDSINIDDSSSSTGGINRTVYLPDKRSKNSYLNLSHISHEDDENLPTLLPTTDLQTVSSPDDRQQLTPIERVGSTRSIPLQRIVSQNVVDRLSVPINVSTNLGGVTHAIFNGTTGKYEVSNTPVMTTPTAQSIAQATNNSIMRDSSPVISNLGNLGNLSSLSRSLSQAQAQQQQQQAQQQSGTNYIIQNTSQEIVGQNIYETGQQQTSNQVGHGNFMTAQQIVGVSATNNNPNVVAYSDRLNQVNLKLEAISDGLESERTSEVNLGGLVGRDRNNLFSISSSMANAAGNSGCMRCADTEAELERMKVKLFLLSEYMEEQGVDPLSRDRLEEKVDRFIKNRKEWL